MWGLGLQGLGADGFGLLDLILYPILYVSTRLRVAMYVDMWGP